MQEVRREIENRLAVMNRLKIYTEVLINQGSADDILRDGNSLRCKMKEKLKIESLQRALSNMNSVDIRFIPARNTRRGDGNVVGQIDAQKGNLSVIWKLSLLFSFFYFCCFVCVSSHTFCETLLKESLPNFRNSYASLKPDVEQTGER